MKKKNIEFWQEFWQVFMPKIVCIIIIFVPLISFYYLAKYRFQLTTTSKNIITVFVVAFLILITVIFHIVLNKTNKESKKPAINICSIILATLFLIPYTMYLFPSRTIEVEKVLVTNIQGEYVEGDWWCYHDMSEFGGVPYVANMLSYDTNKYTYLFSFGYEVKNIHYNVWDLSPQDAPIFDLGAGRRFAKIETTGEFTAGKLYVYRFSKNRLLNIMFTKYRGGYDDWNLISD